MRRTDEIPAENEENKTWQERQRQSEFSHTSVCIQKGTAGNETACQVSEIHHARHPAAPGLKPATTVVFILITALAHLKVSLWFILPAGLWITICLSLRDVNVCRRQINNIQTHTVQTFTQTGSFYIKITSEIYYRRLCVGLFVILHKSCWRHVTTCSLDYSFKAGFQQVPPEGRHQQERAELVQKQQPRNKNILLYYPCSSNRGLQSEVLRVLKVELEAEPSDWIRRLWTLPWFCCIMKLLVH